jgi:broad specificity phosphatase PhoE
VRHGQSQWQIQATNDYDSPLTMVGHRQARGLAKWFTRPRLFDGEIANIDTLCVSPAIRAQETAKYLSKVLDVSVYTYPVLREANFNVADYLPEFQSPLERQESCIVSEPYLGFKSQARSTLETLLAHAEKSRGSVLAITHRALLNTMFRLIVGNDGISFQIYNTGLNVIEWKRGRWHFICLNRCDHLHYGLRTA